MRPFLLGATAASCLALAVLAVEGGQDKAVPASGELVGRPWTTTDCARLADYRAALTGPVADGDPVAAILEQLRRVPPVAWVEGYLATPIAVGTERPGSRLPGPPPVSPEDAGPAAELLLALALTADGLREEVGLPFVGELPWPEPTQTVRPGVFVIPIGDPEGAVLEYLPPPAEPGKEAPCHAFCGDPQAWDFDGDREPNVTDEDDDGDGILDASDVYPYWPRASECDCNALAFVGFTGKFSAGVTREVLAAHEFLARRHEPLALGRLGSGPESVWLVLPGGELCPPDAAGCPEPDDPAVRYVSRDPDDCARLRFRCDPGRAPFSNACGCGCLLAPGP